MKKLQAIYSILVGIGLFCLWCLLYAFGDISEVVARPWETTLHLSAEFTTALLLIVSGLGLLARRRWAERVNIFATGMLVYSLIQSPGTYLQQGAFALVALFGVCFVLTIVLSPVFKPEA
jgi:hypothetical protein